MSEFKKLFEPRKIGSMGLKNRIVFAPLVTHMATEGGFVTDRQIAYYAERARGGAGLIVIEAAYPRAIGYPGRIMLRSDGVIPGLKKLVEAVHNEGAKIVCQVNTHRGRGDETDPASPSGIPDPIRGIKPRVITHEDIKRLQEEFVEGVRRVEEAGFDGVMIHGATGYLIAEFLSPLVNQRTDEYGGDARGRARFALELVEVTRKRVGPDYPIIFRLTADERTGRGFTMQDGVALCKMLEEVSVDCVDVTTGSWEAHEWTNPIMPMPPGCNVDASEAIKKAVKIPVGVAGRINDPYLAEEILRDGKADFICLGRVLLADAEWGNKAKEERVEDICKCIGCGRCGELFWTHVPLTCALNPSTGNEEEFNKKLKPAEKKKKVLVAGGGPGGIEAALIAAKKGHDVALWEVSDKLGGQLNLAIIPPDKDDIKVYLDYLKSQLAKSAVKVELNKRATTAAIEEFAPDAAVIAIGSTSFTPDIPGINGEKVVDHREILAGEKEVGNRVIVMGGGYLGCETADFLAEKGKNVMLVFRSAEPAEDVIYPDNKKLTLKKLEKVTVLSGVKQYLEITAKGIKLINKEGKEVFMEADNIVLATGATPDKDLAQSLRGKVPELYEAGDCVEARRILEAVHEGARAALEI